jgi:hypothetical protein
MTNRVSERSPSSWLEFEESGIIEPSLFIGPVSVDIVGLNLVSASCGDGHCINFTTPIDLNSSQKRQGDVFSGGLAAQTPPYLAAVTVNANDPRIFINWMVPAVI